MVTVKYTETPVNETITPTNTLTVPTGEVWDVTVTAVGENSDGYIQLDINGNAGPRIYQDATGGHLNNLVFDTKFVGGDTISISGPLSGGGLIHVSGWAVQNTVDNTPVSETISTGTATISPPSGEVWNLDVLALPSGFSGIIEIDINGNSGPRLSADGANEQPKKLEFETVLEDTDSISISDNITPEGFIHVGGFDVS